MRDVHEAASIAETMIDDPANVDLARHDLAFQAALQGYLQALLTAGQIVSEMAAEHARNGHGARAAALREATVQIASVPEGSAVRPERNPRQAYERDGTEIAPMVRASMSVEPNPNPC